MINAFSKLHYSSNVEPVINGKQLGIKINTIQSFYCASRNTIDYDV